MAKKRKSHITLPRSYDPGPGYPRETLAYLSEAEHELIRKLTDGKWNRGPKGVRSYADDSASSKGVSRGDNSGTKGSGGLGQGGQGSGGSAGSKSGGSSGASSSSSSSSSKSSSSGSSSSSSSSSSGAGRDSSRGIGQGAGGSAIGRGGASTATGKAAEAAKANAARGGAVSNPVSMSGALDSGYYHSFTNSLPGMANPTRFDNTIRPTNMVTAAHVPVDTWSKRYNANALSPGAQKIHQAIVDNAFRTNTPVDFFSGRSPRSSGTLQHPLGQAIDVRLKDPVTGAFVGTPQIGALAANPIGNVRPLMGRSNKVASAIQGALEKPYREFAKGVLNSFMDNPGVYGDFNNQRWGGSFGGTWGKDYMHYDEGKITSAVNADQAALRKEAANYRGPGAAGGTMLAGSLTNSVFSGGAAPTQVAGIANGGLTQAAAEARAKKATTGLDAIQKAATPPSAFASDPRLGVPQGALPAAPLRSTAGTYTTPYNPEVQGPLRYGGPLDKIPTPNSTGYATLMTPAFAADPRLSVPQGSYPAAPPKSAFASDPRLSVPQGAYPAAKPPSAFAADPRLSIPQGAYPAAKPPSAFAADPRLGVPQGAYPARAQTTVAGDPRLSQTPVGAFPAARPSSQVYTDPRVSQTPLGAFPAAQKPASVFAEDPRVATTPLGSLPAAKPKEIQLAWNVPPMGGALPGQAAWGLGLWGTNRPLPTGPGAQPGTIHSQTADATSAPPASEDKPSFWQQAGDLYNTASTAAKEKVEEIKQDPGFKFAQKYPRLAEFALKMMMGGGGTPNPNGFGNPQDRSGYVTRPQPPQAPQMAQAQGGVSTDPLTILTNLQANMIAQGASPEELAYVQSIIDELTNSQVA